MLKVLAIEFFLKIVFNIYFFQFTAKDQARTSVSVTVCDQPSPRSNFSMTALPSGESVGVTELV